MLKFIHAADIHLDSPLVKIGQYDDAPTELLRTATRQALVRLVNLALDERVAFLVIAGDLYDGDWDDVRTGLFMVDQLRRLREASIPVYLIAGNHDAANRMTKNVPLPENAIVLDHRRPETKILESCGVAIHGQGFANPAVTENLAVNFPKPITNFFNIGLLHTAVEGREGHDPYCPCSLDDLRAKGYDYWALGHIHKREVLCEAPWIAFSGNLQGRHVRETGAKGAYLVTVDENRRAQAEFRELDVVRWERLSIDVRDAASVADLHDAFRERIQGLRSVGDLPWAVRVEFSGACPIHETVLSQPRRQEEELRAITLDAGDGRVWLEQAKFNLKPPSNPDWSIVGDGPLAEVDHLVAEYLASDASMLELAEAFRDLRDKLPPELDRVTEGKSLTDSAALRELLTSVAPMLHECLRRREASP